ncbi:MAG: hypothetical protein OEV64_01205 [Desulfobulbaceae bacterium]|nr:hypothetical protein [Desulfobulbaceae bacterium]
MQHTQVYQPLIHDAQKYFIAAYNLATFGNYSLELPNADGTPPESATDLSPGFPIFITYFFNENSTIESVVESIQKAHVVLGSLTVVITFLLARLTISFTGALLSGTLTAISPHLISTESYVLTETLYTFVLMLGSLLFALGWMKNKPLLTGISGLILAFSSQVRTISIFYIWFLLPLLFICPEINGLTPRKKSVIHLFSLILGFLVVTACYHQFKGYAISRDSWLKEHITQDTRALSNQLKKTENNFIPNKKLHKQLSTIQYSVTPPNDYQSIKDPLEILKNSIKPPKFFIQNLQFATKKEAFTYRQKNRKLTTEPFSKHPFKYIAWNLWGKYLTFWNWDNIYVGDVFIYPMTRTGFEEIRFHSFIHKLMHTIHILLYTLSLSGLILFLVLWSRSSLIFPEQGLAVSVSGFIYFHCICTVNAFYPRYSIPVRPFSYIVAAFMLTWTIKYLYTRSQKVNFSGLNT